MSPTPKRPTSLDVAKHAGVSRATVSMVLNGRTEGTVSAETRARVLAAAEELQYARSRAALSLREQRSKTIGIVSDEILTSPWAGRMLRAADAAALERGYITLSMDLSIPGMTHERAVRTLEERDVDGLVFATMGATHITIPPRRSPLPVVLLNCSNTIPAPGHPVLPDFSREQLFPRVDDRPTIAAVGRTLYPEFLPDDYQGGYNAAERLLDVGHTRIAMFAPDGNQRARFAREAGFLDACRDAGESPRIVRSGWDYDAGYRSGVALLREPEATRPTAVFCIRDRVAAGLLHAAAAEQVNVPGELSVIGFDDEDFFAEKLVPALSTMALPHLEMGRASMNTLIDLVEGKDDVTDSERTSFQCPLVERETVAQPPL